MEEKEIKENNKLTVDILLNSKEEAKVVMGGDSRNPSWEEYLNDFKEGFQPHFILIKEALEKSEYMGITGEDKQKLGISFKFSDGQHWTFSWRAWGDLMQAIVNKKEGYMKYYM